MSIQAVAWALDQDIGDPAAKLVLISLANAYNQKEGRCFPTRKQIAANASISERSVVRKLQQLEAAGWIAVAPSYDETTRRQQANEYLLLGFGSSPIGCQPVTPPHGRVSDCHPCHGEGDSSGTGEGDTVGTGEGDSCVTPLKEPEEVPEEERKKGASAPSASAGAVAALPIGEAYDAWSETASRHRLPEIRDRSRDRTRRLQAILRDHGLDGWRQALLALGSTGFLTGRNERGWRANFDWVTKPANFAKLIEGTYAQERDGPAAMPGAVVQVDWGKRLGYWARTGTWYPDEWGPAPGAPGCQAPVELVEQADRGRERIAAAANG